MEVVRLTRKIYNNHKKVWGKLREEYHNKRVCLNAEIVIKYDIEYGLIGISNNTYGGYFIIPFNMLYGLLESFFEENGFIIIINLHSIYETFNFKIYSKEEAKIIYKYEYDYGYISSLKETKELAILKVCEILEGKLCFY